MAIPSSSTTDTSKISHGLEQLEQALAAADFATYVSLLRQCGNAKALSQGKRVHAHMIENGYGGDRFLGNFVAQMYSKCGSLEDAQAVFQSCSQRNVFSWSIMVAAYAQNGHSKEAFKVFYQMNQEGVHPNGFTLVAILGACSDMRDLIRGREIHARVAASGYEPSVFVSTAIVNMYGKCRSLDDARDVFNRMANRDAVAWNAMLSAYAQRSHGGDALVLYRRMILEGMKPNHLTFVSALDACSSLEALAEGRKIHAQIAALSSSQPTIVGNSLINMYSKCGAVDDARRVFDTMQQKDAVTWNTMIGAYAQHEELGREAIELYQRMRPGGVKPDSYTFVSVLEACSRRSGGALLDEGRMVHAELVGDGLEAHLVVMNAVVNMYGKCGSLQDARLVFEKMQERDVISWNIMISAYAQHGQGEDALQLFRRMDLEGIKADEVVFIGALESSSTREQGKLLHERIVASGFDYHSVVVRNALISMYARCGELGAAKIVFDSLLHHRRDIVSWNSMIGAYAQHGHTGDALELYKQLNLEGVKPDEITLASILGMCSNVGAMLEEGRKIHQHAMECGLLSTSVLVASSLVNMYGKCGNLEAAKSLFSEVLHEIHDVVPWTAMLSAYAQCGQGKEALQGFWQMRVEGIEPNEITFLTLLDACSHSGLVDEARQCFLSISEDHWEAPGIEHYGCMIDLLGRVGMIDPAEELMREMPFEPDSLAWTSFLGACRSNKADALEVHRVYSEGISALTPPYMCPQMVGKGQTRKHARLLNMAASVSSQSPRDPRRSSLKLTGSICTVGLIFRP